MDIGIILKKPVENLASKYSIPLERLSKAARVAGHRFLLFTIADVDLDKDLVLAHELVDAKTRWVRGLNPIPSLIYNQLDNSSLPTRAAQKTFSRLAAHLHGRHPPGTIFNLHQLNKFEAYQLLAQHKHLRRFLPETHLYDPERLPDFLHRHGAVYLKPLNRSRGKGIIYITANGKGDLAVKFRIQEQLCLGRSGDMGLLLSFLPRIMLEDTYLMQAAIDLAKIDGCPFLFRVHLLKDKGGQWIVAGRMGRVGTKHDYLISRTFGARYVKADELIAQAFPSRAKKLHKKIDEMNLAIASILEQENPYVLGELGTDTALDKNCQVKLIEVNYKPNWLLFNEVPEIQAEMCRIFLDFCLFLGRSKGLN